MIYLRHRGFRGAMWWDDGAGLFFGRALGIKPDVVTFQGRTGEEAREAFRESIDDYLDFRAERGAGDRTGVFSVIRKSAERVLDLHAESMRRLAESEGAGTDPALRREAEEYRRAALEDAEDLADARTARDEEGSIPLEDLKRELGL